MNEQRTKKYKILKDPLASRLETIVQEHIDSGWQPQGNPFIAGHLICQAMVYIIEINHDLRHH
jgi:hypothetical protein